MDRRDFLKTTSTMIAGATLAPSTLAGRAGGNGSEGRLVLPINRNWRYSKKFRARRPRPRV